MSMKLRNRMTGLSLIELMIAMVLGLMIMAGVASIFSANSQINRSAQNVSRVQESARTVFEMIGRDLRDRPVPVRVRQIASVNASADGQGWRLRRMHTDPRHSFDEPQPDSVVTSMH